MNIDLDKIVTRILQGTAAIGVVGVIFITGLLEAKRQQEKEERMRPAIETIDPAKLISYVDTVIVVNYKPYTKGYPSITHTINRSGKKYNIQQKGNLPVERGDEIIISIRTGTTPEGKTITDYKLVKNITTEKLTQEYMNKR